MKLFFFDTIMDKHFYYFSDSSTEMIYHIENNGGFPPKKKLKESLKDFTFYEFDLKDLGLPSSDELLERVQETEKEIGIRGWLNNGKESENYKGFSLTYNPDFIFQNDISRFHQPWGSPLLSQNFSRNIDFGSHEQTKNTYYDSYAFRKIDPLIQKNFGVLIDKLNMPLLRNRVAYKFGFARGFKKPDEWHIDEFPYVLLRINIPLQTSEEHVIDISGKDEYGNFLEIENKHLEKGKLYIWNTRIPHRIVLRKPCAVKQPRIHIVLGLSPWFDYVNEEDYFCKNKLWSENLKALVEKKLFLKGK